MYAPLQKLESRIAPQPASTIILSFPYKYQPAKAGLAGFLFACPLRGRGYNIITDYADETYSPSGPLTLRDIPVPNNANKTKLSLAPSTLPEYAVEVELC